MFRSVIRLACAAAVFAVACQSAPAQKVSFQLQGTGTLSGSGQATIFSDNFANGPSPLWGNEFGDWTASGGVYYATTPTSFPIGNSSLPFNLTDFSIDVDMNSVTQGAGVWLRSSGWDSAADPSDVTGVLFVAGAEDTRFPSEPMTFSWQVATERGKLSRTLNEVAYAGFAPPFLGPPPGTNIHVHISVTENSDGTTEYVADITDGAGGHWTTSLQTSLTSGETEIYSPPGEAFGNLGVATVWFPFASGQVALAYGYDPNNLWDAPPETFANVEIQAILPYPDVIVATGTATDVLGNFQLVGGQGPDPIAPFVPITLEDGSVLVCDVSVNSQVLPWDDDGSLSYVVFELDLTPIPSLCTGQFAVTMGPFTFPTILDGAIRIQAQSEPFPTGTDSADNLAFSFSGEGWLNLAAVTPDTVRGVINFSNMGGPSWPMSANLEMQEDLGGDVASVPFKGQGVTFPYCTFVDPNGDTLACTVGLFTEDVIWLFPIPEECTGRFANVVDGFIEISAVRRTTTAETCHFTATGNGLLLYDVGDD